MRDHARAKVSAPHRRRLGWRWRCWWGWHRDDCMRVGLVAAVTFNQLSFDPRELAATERRAGGRGTLKQLDQVKVVPVYHRVVIWAVATAITT